MQCVIRYESGWRYRSVRERVEETAREVGPVVEQVTGLSLPPRPVLRLVTIAAYGAESLRHAQRRAEQDLHDSDLQGVDTASLHRWLAAQRRLSGVHWVASRAETVISPAGLPEVLLPPGGARRAGALGELLYETLAHELTHLAQWQASQRGDGQLFRLRGTGVPAAHGVADLALAAVMEGHAHWVQNQVTAKLLGHPPRRDRTTWLYRHLRTKTAPVTAGMKQAATRGEEFVARVHHVTGGTAVLDRIWRTPTLAPTCQEITEPDAWLSRQGLTG